MRRRQQQQGGFALLFVFVMAAGIALMLYSQLPRTAFESMRGKEELLVDHAHEYERGIQLYVAKFQKYPQSMDDLEKTNNVRFLRRRFKNPFTGKDDWRIIHVDNAGRLTDSLIQKKEEKKPNQNMFITENAGVGQTLQPEGDTGVNVALRKRPSEGGDAGPNQAPLPVPSSGYPAPYPAQMQPQQGQFPQQQGQFPQQQQQGQPPQVPNPIVDPTQAQNAQQAQGMQQGQPGQPGQFPVPAGQVDPNNPNLRAIYPNGVPQYPGQVNPNIDPRTGLPYQPGQQPQQQQQQQPPNPYAQQSPYAQQAQNRGNQPTYPTQPATGVGAGAGTSTSNTTPNSVMSSIMNQLTSPSPNMPMNLAPGLQIMGGIAGIAPKNEGPSIRIVNEQTNYKKWEFVYDMKKDNRMKQAVGNAMNNMNNNVNRGPDGQPTFPNQNKGQPQFPNQYNSQQPFGQPPSGFGQPSFGQQPKPVGYGPGNPAGTPQPIQQPVSPQPGFGPAGSPPPTYSNPFDKR